MMNVKCVKKLIDPTAKKTNFYVSNSRKQNKGLDCDKFDYIARDTYNIGIQLFIRL